ncbi:hypothetical protein Taro_001529 [Colocasia esculenta]|uniref:GB1/RHD3-type G domain-containing protein n=1 Tax=Colocasia esculenta TaxID=4460 RepID=A0A843TJA8_COLES|nr:hypothetical protein [Colocasia esculenta]
MGGIDEAALDRLSLVTEMTKHIRVRASGGRTTASELGQFSPLFVWLLRDFYLDLVEDNRKLTPRDYLELALRPMQGGGKDISAKNEIRESIRALFPDRECFTLVRPLNNESELQRLDQILVCPNFDVCIRFYKCTMMSVLCQLTRPKQVGATVMTGPVLAGVTQSFLDALNNGAVPTISSSWQGVGSFAGTCPAAFRFPWLKVGISHRNTLLALESVVLGAELSCRGDEESADVLWLWKAGPYQETLSRPCAKVCVRAVESIDIKRRLEEVDRGEWEVSRVLNSVFLAVGSDEEEVGRLVDTGLLAVGGSILSLHWWLSALGTFPTLPVRRFRVIIEGIPIFLRDEGGASFLSLWWTLPKLLSSSGVWWRRNSQDCRLLPRATTLMLKDRLGGVVGREAGSGVVLLGKLLLSGLDGLGRVSPLLDPIWPQLTVGGCHSPGNALSLMSLEVDGVSYRKGKGLAPRRLHLVKVQIGGEDDN